jgi:hypothetical protein
MATKPVHSIAGQLNAGQLAINNSLSDPEIQSLVAQFGYPADKLNEGKALYDAALAAVNAEKAQAGGRQESTRLLAQAEKSARRLPVAGENGAGGLPQGQGSTQRSGLDRQHAP